MNQQQIWQQLTALSPHEQQQVLDFLSFLHWRHTQKPQEKQENPSNLRQSPFIGMWADHNDLKDSTAWIRTLRQQEWG